MKALLANVLGAFLFPFQPAKNHCPFCVSSFQQAPKLKERKAPSGLVILPCFICVQLLSRFHERPSHGLSEL